VAYDEALAARVDAIVPELEAPVETRRMFGGLCYLVDGHMFAGIIGDELIARLGDAGAAEALTKPHVREFDFTGRPARGIVFVAQDGLKGKALRTWVVASADYARSLPPKKPRPPKKRAAPRPR
jgi:hypothetical protein